MIRTQSTIWLTFLAVISLPLVPFLSGAALVALIASRIIHRYIGFTPPTLEQQVAMQRARANAVRKALS